MRPFASSLLSPSCIIAAFSLGEGLARWVDRRLLGVVETCRGWGKKGHTRDDESQASLF